VEAKRKRERSAKFQVLYIYRETESVLELKKKDSAGDLF
jgi:hypothetical protein